VGPGLGGVNADAVGRIDPDKDVGIGGRGFDEEASVSAMMLRRSTLLVSNRILEKGGTPHLLDSTVLDFQVRLFFGLCRSRGVIGLDVLDAFPEIIGEGSSSIEKISSPAP